MDTRSDTDIAWCAGFFDGEGHVSYRRGYVRPNRRVQGMLHAMVPQTSDNIEVLEFFQSVVNMGKIKGPYKTARKDQHRLMFGTKEVMPLLQLLAPYLRKEKSSNFRLALAAYWAHDPRATPEDHKRTLKWRQKRGCTRCKAKWNGIVCMECGLIE